MESTKNFDQRLRDLLIISGVRREDLACHLGVSVPMVNRWLNGSSVPDVYQFQSIANYFGMPYEWFLEVGDGFPSAEKLAARLGLSERWMMLSGRSLALCALCMAKCSLLRSSFPVLPGRPSP